MVPLIGRNYAPPNGVSMHYFGNSKSKFEYIDPKLAVIVRHLAAFPCTIYNVPLSVFKRYRYINKLRKSVKHEFPLIPPKNVLSLLTSHVRT